MRGIREVIEEAERVYKYELDGWFIVNEFITALWVMGIDCECSSITWEEWRKRGNYDR